MERNWKLGDDLCTSDNILDPITFEDVILAVHCNCPKLTQAAVMREARHILEQRLEDYRYILAKNVDEILAQAAIGRECDGSSD